MIKLNLGLFLSTAAMLFYVVRYRIHVHVEYTPRHRRARAKGSARFASEPKRAADKNLGGGLSTVARDLESALVNLGASRKEAQERTAAALAQGPADFDTLCFRAMQAGSRK